jgi:hypothetical protein
LVQLVVFVKNEPPKYQKNSSRQCRILLSFFGRLFLQPIKLSATVDRIPSGVLQIHDGGNVGGRRSGIATRKIGVGYGRIVRPQASFCQSPSIMKATDIKSLLGRTEQWRHHRTRAIIPLQEQGRAVAAIKEQPLPAAVGKVFSPYFASRKSLEVASAMTRPSLPTAQ